MIRRVSPWAERRFARRLRELARHRRFVLLRWFGVRRTTGFLLLAAFLALRIWDPAPLENLRLRNFDFYQVIKPRIVTMQPGGDRRYRRSEPAARSGNGRGRARCSPSWCAKLQQAGSAVDRLRHHLRGARPHVAGGRRRQPAADRRGDARQAAKLPSNDEVLRRGDASRAASCSDNPAIATDWPSRPTRRRRPASPPSAPIRRPSWSPSTACCAIFRCWKKPPPAAACSPSSPNATASCGGVPLVMKAGGTIVPAMTLEMLRVVTNSGAILLQHRSGRHARGRGARPRIADRPERPALDQFQRRTIRARYVSAKDVMRRQCPGRPLRRQAGADRHVGGRAARPQGDAGRRRRCRASRCMRRCWKTR